MNQIRLLGPIELARDDAPLRPLETRKAYALLAYLVRRPQPIPRAQLADLLWSTLSEARGRRNLSHALTLLTNALPGCITADYQTLHYQPTSDYWCDVTAFENLTRAGQPANTLWSAVGLSRGDFLAGVYFDDCPEFETWLLREQEHWRTQLTRVLERLVHLHAARQQFSDAQRALERWLSVEPWSEQAHEYLMRVFAAQGDRRAALAQFERAQNILTRELNVTPAAETRTLYEQIRENTYDPVAVTWGLADMASPPSNAAPTPPPQSPRAHQPLYRA